MKQSLTPAQQRNLVCINEHKAIKAYNFSGFSLRAVQALVDKGEIVYDKESREFRSLDYGQEKEGVKIKRPAAVYSNMSREQCIDRILNMQI